MKVSPAMMRTLQLVAQCGPACRESLHPKTEKIYSPRPSAHGQWRWTVDGQTTNGNVDRLIRSGHLLVDGDRAVLTAKGRALIPHRGTTAKGA